MNTTPQDHLRSHISSAQIEDSNGKVRKWWRLDFATPKGVAATVGVLLAVLGVFWSIYATVTVAVLDPHIRGIVREEVPKAMVDFVDAAVEKAARPHMEVAKMQHATLQTQIDIVAKAIVSNREEREKFQAALMARDVEQREETAALRLEIVRLNGTVQDIYDYLLKHPGVTR
jgi:hypothetical protein